MPPSALGPPGWAGALWFFGAKGLTVGRNCGYNHDMSTTEIHNEIRKHIAAKSTADLVEMMKISDDRAVTMFVADELCSRNPEIVAALDEWENDLESDESLTDVILKAVG